MQCILNGMQTALATGLAMVYVYGATVAGGVLLVMVRVHKLVLAFDASEGAGQSI